MLIGYEILFRINQYPFYLLVLPKMAKKFFFKIWTFFD
ncbi:hypothetical protein T4A_13246 [Trichinella pseudospiralis]|uniref:Uncharacterized protein n=1 Tax=Trichinella pseudospiralis TaxID=6337 RepID=A0A0V1AJR4_TRIPS|nr:hypothetical protein T4A_13246 [Trichinella pseudospiralis]